MLQEIRIDSDAVLAAPDFEDPNAEFIICTDASDYAVGGVPMQWQHKNPRGPAPPADAMAAEVGIRRCAGEERGASAVRQMSVVCCEAGGCAGGGGLVGRSVGEPSLHLRTARSDVEAKKGSRSE